MADARDELERVVSNCEVLLQALADDMRMMISRREEVLGNLREAKQELERLETQELRLIVRLSGPLDEPRYARAFGGVSRWDIERELRKRREQLHAEGNKEFESFKVWLADARNKHEAAQRERSRADFDTEHELGVVRQMAALIRDDALTSVRAIAAAPEAPANEEDLRETLSEAEDRIRTGARYVIRMFPPAAQPTYTHTMETHRRKEVKFENEGSGELVDARRGGARHRHL
jgi:hypothetical protein